MNQQGLCFPLSDVPVGLKKEGLGLALWVSDLVESVMWQCQDQEAEMRFVEIISPAVTIFTNAHNSPFTFLQAKKKKKKSASLHRCTPISCAPVLPEPPYLSSKEKNKRSISTPGRFFGCDYHPFSNILDVFLGTTLARDF